MTSTIASSITAKTAETQFATAAGVDFAHRRLGRGSEVPLVMLQHFRGNLDNWDPALIDALATDREVIVVDYPGVGASTGEPDRTIAATARQMLASSGARPRPRRPARVLDRWVRGPGDRARAPDLVRRLVLAATGPKGAPGMHGWRDDIATAARREQAGEPPLHHVRAPATSQAKGVEFLGRFLERQDGRDARRRTARDAQYDAIVEWGIPDHGALQRLTGIQSPTLILQGDADLMIPPKVSHLMAGLIPNAEIRIYPDAAHGFLFQYPADVARDVNAFLAQDHEEDRS